MKLRLSVFVIGFTLVAIATLLLWLADDVVDFEVVLISIGAVGLLSSVFWLYVLIFRESAAPDLLLFLSGVSVIAYVFGRWDRAKHPVFGGLFCLVLIFVGEAIRTMTPTLYLAQADTRANKGELESAIDSYTEVIRRDPSCVAAYNNRGSTWLQKGDVEKALADFTEAIRLDPKLALPYINRGYASQSKEDLEKAIEDYTHAIRLEPTSARTYHNRGFTWALKGDLDNGIKDYTEAIRLDPKFAMSYNNRGFAWFTNGNLANAIEDYDRALRLDPTAALPYNNLAWLMATCHVPDFRNGPKAIEYARKACELTEWQDANMVNTLAAAYAEAGEFQNALEQQEKAIALSTADADKRAMLDRLELYKTGKAFRDDPK